MNVRPGIFAVAAIAAATGLSGCSGLNASAGDAGSIGLGAAVGLATGNPIIGVAVGIASNAALNAGIDYVEREQQAATQEAIAAKAGSAPVDEWVSWATEAEVELDPDAGRLIVVREFGDAFPCREIIFTEYGQRDRFYTATVCRGTQKWSWAVAEPATERWGDLQ